MAAGEEGTLGIGENTSGDSSGMVMNDIVPALEVYKAGRADSSNMGTSDASTCLDIRSAGLPGASSAFSSATSPNSSSSGDSVIRIPSPPSTRVVRFADECGGELESIRTATNWWQEMVFGPDEEFICCCAQSTAETASGGNNNNNDHNRGVGPTGSESNSNSGGNSNSGDFHSSAPLECVGMCTRSTARRSVPRRSELYRFIEELSRGVEASLVLPGVIAKKKRSVLLYTEDDGESICWMETGSGRPPEPYRIPSKTLLKVKDKSGVAVAGAKGGLERAPTSTVGGNGGERSPMVERNRFDKKRRSIFASLKKGGARNTSSKEASSLATAVEEAAAATAAAITAAGGGGRGGEQAGLAPTSSSVEHPAALMVPGDSLEETVDDACDRSGRDEVDVRIHLAWRLKPTWSLRKATIADVQCDCPDVFRRGMQELRKHNPDLQD